MPKGFCTDYGELHLTEMAEQWSVVAEMTRSGGKSWTIHPVSVILIYIYIYIYAVCKFVFIYYIYIWYIHVTYGVAPMVSRHGVMRMVLRIWCRAYGVSHTVSCVWCRAYGVAHMVSRTWCHAYGVAHMVSRIWWHTYGVAQSTLNSRHDCNMRTPASVDKNEPLPRPRHEVIVNCGLFQEKLPQYELTKLANT